MQYTTIVEHSDDGLNLIYNKAVAFDRESVLEGILVRKYDVYDIEQMIADVQEFHAKLKREINSVVKFAGTFNKQFATDNNKCFEIAERLFRKIRSSVSGTKKIYRKFCKTMRKKYPGIDGNIKASVFTHSVLASGSFNRDLFGEEAYPKVVKTLCNELESFFSDLAQIIMICKEVSDEEQRILNNPNNLTDLYQSDCNLTRGMHQGVVSMMKDNNVMPSLDPMTKHKKNHSLQVFLRETFHKFNRKEFTMHIVNEELENGRKNGLDDDEALYWADHHEIVPQIRLVIKHFDELEPKGRKDNKSGKYKISGVIMARLIKWCYLEGSKFEAPFVNGYFKKHYKGNYEPIKANTVNNAKCKFTKKGLDPGYAEFEQQVEALLKKYENKQENRLSVVANF